MNTDILNPKVKLLIGAGLDVLHFESREWLDNIAFWKDEARFFEVILKKAVKDKSQQEYGKLLQELDRIHVDLFSDMEESILKHERLLAKIEKGEKGLSDNDYRQEHFKYMERMDTFSRDFRSFKKIVFDYAKQD